MSVTGIVVVSHSPALAAAAVELALEMVPGAPPPIAVAAGSGDGVFGTDATRVAEAIEEVAAGDSGPSGVAVLMDLGSAVMSAELALEFLPEGVPQVRLVPAPFVEGLIAAVVRAAGGATLDEVATEASAALAAKAEALSAPPPVPAGTPAPTADAPLAASVPADGAGPSARVCLPNGLGLHARPAARLAARAAELGVDVKITNVTKGKGPASARSPMALMALGAGQGDELLIEATSSAAAAAVSEFAALAADGFGELSSPVD
ncbi:MAG: HPr family phosphocarrier protein [Bifidobacteriaceae bacterium]|jgi:dihydroxyacetone kinase phosphotransfer subunit|nr:HPr family phosphocarrier protein [Bifidobacteriaceae bacterium]